MFNSEPIRMLDIDILVDVSHLRWLSYSQCCCIEIRRHPLNVVMSPHWIIAIMSKICKTCSFFHIIFYRAISIYAYAMEFYFRELSSGVFIYRQTGPDCCSSIDPIEYIEPLSIVVCIANTVNSHSWMCERTILFSQGMGRQMCLGLIIDNNCIKIYSRCCSPSCAHISPWQIHIWNLQFKFSDIFNINILTFGGITTPCCTRIWI